MTHLSKEKLSQRAANANYDRRTLKGRMDRGEKKLEVLDAAKYEVSEKARKHLEKAMKELAENKNSQQGLAQQIFDVLKKLEANGKYTKGEPITMDRAKDFVATIVNHCKNWVHVNRDRAVACRFNRFEASPKDCAGAASVHTWMHGLDDEEMMHTSTGSPSRAAAEKRAPGTAAKSPFKTTGLSPESKKTKSDGEASSSDLLPRPAVVTNPYKKQRPRPSTAVAAATALTNQSKPSAATAVTFSPNDDLPPPPLRSPEDMLKSVGRKVKAKKLRDGFASYLLEQPSFQKWILIAKEDSTLWPWFESFLDDILDGEFSRAFDHACRKIMDQLFEYAEKAMSNRRSTKTDSFEYSLFHYQCSDELYQTCSAMLPTEAMKASRPAHTILACELGSIVIKWYIETVRFERKQKNPELFERTTLVNLSDEALKSEVHRLMGWAVKDCKVKKKFADRSAENHLLDQMICLEKDVDEDFISNCLDFATLIRNTGGEGGLSLITAGFLDWATKAMLAIAKQLTVDDIRQKGDTALRTATNAILKHPTLKSDFALVCTKQEQRSLQLCRENSTDADDVVRLIADPREPKMSYSVAANVFVEVMTKICHARFGEILKNFSEKEALHGTAKVNFRTSLAVSSKAAAAAASSANANAASGYTAATAAASAPVFEAPQPGVNNAMSSKFLNGKTFVFDGLFDEVHTEMREAHRILKEMLESFGASVNKRFSSNTSEYTFSSLDCSYSHALSHSLPLLIHHSILTRWERYQACKGKGREYTQSRDSKSQANSKAADRRADVRIDGSALSLDKRFVQGRRIRSRWRSASDKYKRTSLTGEQHSSKYAILATTFEATLFSLDFHAANDLNEREHGAFRKDANRSERPDGL